MDSLTENRMEVRARRAQLAKSFEDVRRRLSLPQLAEDALAKLDPELVFLGRAQSAIRRNPLLAAGLLAGAVWLVSDASQDGRRSGPDRRARRGGRAINDTTNHKGD
ncbi:MAG: hypothetical protein ACT4SY_08280 [Hyphomicrobiales bacterium]